MSSSCQALVTFPNGKNELMAGTRLAVSPYRLFHLEVSEVPPPFISSLREQSRTFDVVVTDELGLNFFKSIGLDATRIVVLQTQLVTSDELSTVQTKIVDSLSNSSLNQDNVKVWNAMSMYFDRRMIEKIFHFDSKVTLQDFAEMKEFETKAIPKQSWIPIQQNVYPIDVPIVDLKKGMDFLVIDCPARNLSLLPNGVAYLETSLRKNNINYQVLDLDVISYHMFHMHRIFDLGGPVKVDGQVIPEDPWLAHNYDAWSSISEHENRDDEISLLPVHKFFDILLEKTAKAVATANPCILGFSIQQCSEVMSSLFIKRLRKQGLTAPVIVGGFSCYNFDIGLRGFPLADYMCIGEAETTISNLINQILSNGRAKDLAGVLGRFDTPGRVFSAAPMIHNLDTIDFPTYSWTSLKEYINWDGYQLIPIIASRGCRWSRCTFCAERFYWRIRSAKDFVDELEWHVFKGHYLFMFNESDLNGMPERVLEICDEIIARGLHKKVKLTGQLRIHRKSDAAFFAKLRAAGFVALRFGVDSFSRNGMKLQQKGYTPEIVAQNLKDCSEAGIFVEVNWVIGVPGEQESDIDEGIQFILENKNYIGRLANLNPLILVNGSVYWLNPDDYDIHFKEPWEDLRKKFPRAVPAGLWWSEKPFIDASIRQNWFQKVVKELFLAGFPIGDWAKQVIEDVESRKDAMRAEKTYEDLNELGKSSEGVMQTSSLQIDLEIEAKDSFAKAPSHKEYTFVQNFSGYSIYALNDMYYSLHESISVNNLELNEVAIHRAHNLDELKQLILDAVNWANSRGAYGESGKVDMRVDSNLSRPDIPAEIKNSLDVILRVTPGVFFGLDKLKTINNTLMRKPLIRFVVKLSQKFRAEKMISDSVLNLSKQLAKKRNQVIDEHPKIQLYSMGATPELVASWDDQKLNIVRFDGLFYAVPHGLRINLEKLEESVNIIKNLKSSKNLQDLMQELEFKPMPMIESNRDTQRSLAVGEKYAQPHLIKTINKVNIVGFEGFYYAIPHALGEVQLEKMDMVEDSRIFRDVSIYAVEDFVSQSASSS